MKTLIKRISSLICLVLIIICASCSGGNDNLLSESTDETTSTDLPLLLTDAKVNQESQMSMMKANAIKENNGYLDTDVVSVIIKLEEESLIDEYNSGYYKEYSTVAEYASSNDGVHKSTQILEDQNNLIKTLTNAGIVEDVLYQYSTIFNGIAIKTTYGNLSKLTNYTNVADAYLSETYNLPQTTTDYSDYAVTNVVDVYETGIFNSSDSAYNGEGTAVAILDSGYDISHEVFTSAESRPTNPLISQSDVEAILTDTVAYRYSSGNLISGDLYKNVKVPFAYDYADHDFEVEPTTSNHGTHVAGIIGGYYGDSIETIQGASYDSFSGVAIRTQLVLMKVFSDLSDGADTEVLLAGLEDAVLLGVDAINMSLGTSCGFSREYDDEVLNAVYDSINDSGISLVVAASNSYSSGFGGDEGNTNKVTNPESSTVGSPSTYYGALSVASISGTKSNYIVDGNGYVFFYNESTNNTGLQNNFYDDLGITEYTEIEYVTVPGYGIRSNYSNIDVEGKIALVRRGSNTFEEKAQIAKNQGAIGIIIYNNVAGDISMSTGKVTDFPIMSISKDDGEVLASVRSGTLTFDPAYEAGPFMSDFSSWGPTSDLLLKPEITAHGGNIVSSVPGGNYDVLSGTSMACPNMTGVVVLIRQYIKEKYPELSSKEVCDMAYQLLMSTATIALNEEGNPYSPRKQGAGLASLSDATNTIAYLTVTDTNEATADGNRPKLELGDDPNRTGVYEMTFNIVNTSASQLSYNLTINGMTESVSTSDPEFVAEMSYLLNGSTIINSVTGGSYSGRTITVNANETATVTVTYSLTDADKAYIDSSFENGMYVEGYVVLTPTDGSNTIDLNAPFLAFYGDWTEAPMFDLTFYDEESEAYDNAIDEEDKIKADYYPTTPFGTYYNSYVISLGTYVYEMDLSQYDQIPAREDHIVISSNTGTIDGISGIYTGLLRNVYKMDYTITDSVTGEVIWSFTDYNCNKAFSNNGMQTPYFERLNITPESLDLVNNRSYEFKMVGYMDYGDGGVANNKNNSFSFNFTLDDEAPIISNAEYETVYDRTLRKNRYYVTLTVSDNQYVQSVTPIVFTEDGSSYTTLTEYPYPVYGDKGEDTTVRIEITDYVENVLYNDLPTNSGGISSDNLAFIIDDYALNSNIYLCSLPGTKGNLSFTQDGSTDGASMSQAILNVGDMLDLTQYLTSDDLSISMGKDYLKYLTWTSSREDVAIVENGQVIGLSAGTSTITVSNPTFNVNAATITVRVQGSSSETVQDTASLESVRFTYFDVVEGHASAGEGNVLGNENDRTFVSSLPTSSSGASILSIYPGESFQLAYEINPWYLSEDRYTLNWSSTNERVATVDQNGLVTSLTEGSATIRLSVTIDGRESNIMARLTLNVKDPFVIDNRVLNYYKGVGGEVIIPDDEGIYQIADYAFSLYTIDYSIAVSEDDIYANRVPQTNDTITRVVIPEGVTTIGRMAFAGLTALEEVVIPSSVTTIDEMAFLGCTSLKKVTFSGENHVSSLNYMCFANCTSLEEIDLNGIYSLAYGCFENCTSLNNIDLSTIRSTGHNTFKGCTSLANVTIDANTKLARGMFDGCTSLASVTLGQTIIPQDCFANCTNLTSVTFTNNLVYVGTSAFENSGLTNITFNGSVEYLYARAFANNTNLVSVTLPNSSVSLLDEVFAGCTNLTTLVFSENTYLASIGLDSFEGTNLTNLTVDGNSHYSNQDNTNILYSADGKTLLMVAPKANIGDFVVPESVEVIAEGAFANNSSITSLTVTNPNTTIGIRAFANCPNLTTINLPSTSGIKVLDYAFYGNSKLTTVNNLELVSAIGAYSFAEVGLTEITVNTNIGSYAFAGSAITNVTTGNNVEIGYGAFSSATGLTTVVLGTNNVIGPHAFSACSSLNSINLENAVGTIGAYAFYQARSLTTANLAQVTEVGAYAFAEASSLNSLSIPQVIRIESYAFSRVENTAVATRITSLTLPSSLTYLGSYAFANCIALREVVIEEGLTNIGEGAFLGCTALTKVTLPQSVKTISNSAFRNDNRLNIINLENVVTIGAYAFQNNNALTTIDLTCATSLGEGAFQSASTSNLDTVNHADRITTLGAGAFQGTSISSIDLPSLEYLGDSAFSSCANLTTFNFTSNIKYIGHTAFINSNRLNKFTYTDSEGNVVDDGNINSYALLDNGVLYTYAANGNLELAQVPANLDIDTLELLDNTYTIRPYAGNLNTHITSIIFPDTLTTISNFAFYGYTSLTSVEFRSFTAPTLESFMIENTEITYTDPGYEHFNYAYHIFGNVYPYYQFITRVGGHGLINIILPSNDGVIGYNTLIYEGFFDVANATKSDYIAKDNNTLAFLEIINQIPAASQVTLEDEELIMNAVTIMNAVSQDLTIFGYTQAAVDTMYNTINDARYALYALKRANGSEAVRSVQTLLDNLDTTFKLADLEKLQDLARQISSLSRDEQNILDLRNYNELLTSYNDYVATITADNSVANNITSNGYAYSLFGAVSAAVASTGLLGAAIYLIFKGLL